MTPTDASTRSRRKLLAGMGLLLIGGATATRIFKKPPPAIEHEHSHGGDPKLAAQLESLTPDKRLTAVEAALNDSSPEKRLAAVLLLETLGEYGADLARMALRDSDSEVRVEALRALVATKSTMTLPVLLAALDDIDVDIRRDAATRLGARARDKKRAPETVAIGPLLTALNDSDPTVASLSSAALRHLTKNLGKEWNLSVAVADNARVETLARWQAWSKRPQNRFPAPPTIPEISPTRADDAPKLALRTLDGKRIEPARPDSRITILNFWGTWCGPCRAELPDLQKIHASQEKNGVDVVGVAVSETKGDDGVRAFCKANGLTYPQIVTVDNEIQEAYGDIEDVPVTILIDGAGKIRFRFRGIRDEATFLRALDHVRA